MEGVFYYTDKVIIKRERIETYSFLTMCKINRTICHQQSSFFSEMESNVVHGAQESCSGFEDRKFVHKTTSSWEIIQYTTCNHQCLQSF